jgi:hypothetical protein
VTSVSAPTVPAVSLPHTWRPLGPRIMGIVLVVGLFGLCAAVWIGFSARDKAAFSGSEKGTMAFFAILIVGLVHALTRSRVVAREDGISVVNGYRRHEFEWAQIVAVRMPSGAPWPTLDLSDGEVCSVMGIQASDGARARAAVAQLRALLASHAA